MEIRGYVFNYKSFFLNFQLYRAVDMYVPLKSSKVPVSLLVIKDIYLKSTLKFFAMLLF